MNKVLLIDVPMANETKFGRFISPLASRYPPMNLMLLASILRGHGHLTAIIMEGDSKSDLDRELASFKPDLVGITATTLSYPGVAETIRQVRAQYPKLPIVMGGFHPTCSPREVLADHPEVWGVFVGEAEDSFPLFVNNLDQCGTIDDFVGDIPNLVYRGLDGQPVETGSGGGIENLDRLPFVDPDVAPGYFRRFHPAVNRHFFPAPSVTILATRGCPFNCHFCGRQVTGSRIRAHSTDYLINQIRHLKNKHGIRSIFFADELFLFNKTKAMEFCNRLRQEGLEDIRWACTSRVDSLDEKLAAVLKAAGCRQVAFGFESGSDKVLKAINKKASVEKAAQAIALCSQNGLTTYGNFMLGCFEETKESLQATYDFIRANPIDYISLSYFTPMPGSPSWDLWPQYGELLTHDFREFNVYSGLVFLPHGLSVDELKTWRGRIYRDFYLTPKRVAKEIRRSLNSRSLNYLIQRLIRP